MIKEENNDVNKIKNEIQKDLKDNLEYKNLYLRRKEIIKALKKIEQMEERKELLNNYEKTSDEIKDLEIEMAYKILNKLNENEEEKFNKEFNKIVQDNKYKEQVKRQKNTFNKLIKKPNLESNLLYELNSIDTQIATIETDKVKEYIQRNMRK